MRERERERERNRGNFRFGLYPSQTHQTERACGCLQVREKLRFSLTNRCAHTYTHTQTRTHTPCKHMCVCTPIKMNKCTQTHNNNAELNTVYLSLSFLLLTFQSLHFSLPRRFSWRTHLYNFPVR